MVASAIVLVFAVREIGSHNSNTPQPTENSSAPRLPQVFAADPSLGPTTAPVTVILFSDFECPYCAQVAPILRAAIMKYGSQLRIVWKDSPSPQHKQALAAAEAAQCAGVQGRFWEYHDELFANQSKLADDFYVSLATQLGLDMAKFSTCRRLHETYSLIEKNQSEAAIAGVDETPYLFMNGYSWGGSFTVENFDKMFSQVHSP